MRIRKKKYELGNPIKNKNAKEEEIVVMGKVLAPYGVNGWIKVYSFTEKLESFFKPHNDELNSFLKRDFHW